MLLCSNVDGLNLEIEIANAHSNQVECAYLEEIPINILQVLIKKKCLYWLGMSTKQMHLIFKEEEYDDDQDEGHFKWEGREHWRSN